MAEDNNLEPERKDPEPQPAQSENEDAPAGGAEPANASLKGLTPGQRLAAKKAQKAVEKREFKEELKRKEEAAREEEESEAQRLLGQEEPSEPAVPDQVQQAAGDFTDFMQTNRSRILGGIAAVLVAGLGFVGLSSVLGKGSAEQAAAITQALEIESAPIDADTTTGTNEEGKPVFKSRQERTQKAAAAFAEAAKNKPDSLGGAWAQLAEASAKLQLGDGTGSEAVFKRVLEAQKGNAAIEVRALEGLAFAAEIAGKADEAAKRFEDLKRLDQDAAEYHLARLKLEKGDREGAKTLLKGVYDRLSGAADGSASRFLKGEVESRLAEIDSTLVDKGTSNSGGQQFSPEQIQRILEQLRQQQGGGAE